MFKRFWVNNPLLARLMAFMLLPLALLVVALTVFFRQSLPDYSQSVVLEGPDGTVAISRSAEKLPTITGQSLVNTYYGLGYVHAQDRMWQMESLRHLAKGRLAELKGKSALSTDIYMRTLGLELLAADQFENISAETRAWLGAYAAGVNHWLAEQKVLPLEYHISDHVPEQWTEIDSLVVFKLFQYEYSYGLNQELMFSVTANVFGEDKARAMFAQTSQAAEVAPEGYTNSATRAFAEKMLASAQFISHEFGFGEKSQGDYAWALISKEGDQADPLVGSVVHTQAVLPSKFYIAEIRSDELAISGATVPGLPVFLHGRNDSLAWSFVPVNKDVQDLYVEKVSPKDDNTYELAGEWLRIDERMETFQVKADFPKVLRGEITPVTWKVRSTQNGPIVSDAVGNSGAVLSLKWVGMDSSDTSIEGFFALNFASSKQQISEAFEAYRSPLINLVIADKQGNAGKKIVGKLPLRTASNSGLPMPGWDANYQWKGYVSNVSLPEVWAEPGELVIAAAGFDLFVADTQQNFDSIKHEFERTIEQADLRSTNENARLPATISVVKSTDAELASNIIASMDNLVSDAGMNSDLLRLMKGWDAGTKPDDVKATLFYTVVRHVYQQLVADELAHYSQTTVLPGKTQQLILNNINPAFVYKALNDDGSWCDDVRTEMLESCAELIVSAVEQSRSELALLLGGDPEDWVWKKAGLLAYRHTLFGESSAYAMLFNKDLKLKQGAGAVKTQVPSFSRDHGYVKSTDETYSQLIDLGADTGLFYVSTGQSGNIFDDDYASPSLMKLIFK